MVRTSALVHNRPSIHLSQALLDRVNIWLDDRIRLQWWWYWESG